MAKLKLIKGRSYTAPGITVTAKYPFTGEVEEATAKRLVASGYFEALTEEVKTPEKAQEELAAEAEAALKAKFEELNAPDITDEQFKVLLEKMTRDDIDKYATTLGIQTGDAKNKAEAIGKIVTAS